MAKQEKKVFRQSRQRNRILEVLRSTHTHPTADWLYQQLKDEFPNLSLGTVYRNLSTLIEQGLVKKIHPAVHLVGVEDLPQVNQHLIMARLPGFRRIG